MSLHISRFQGSVYGNAQTLNGSPDDSASVAVAGSYAVTQKGLYYLYADAAHTLTFETGEVMLVPSGFTWVHGFNIGNTITVSA